MAPSGACGSEAHRWPGREPDRARRAGSAPGPGQGRRQLRCAQRASPERLGGGSPLTLRGERAPSLGQPRRAAELRSSPAVGAASRLRSEGQRLPTPGAAPPRPVRTPWRSPNPGVHPRPAPNSASTMRDPDRAAGIHRTGGKLVARLQSPLPYPGLPAPPALRGSASSQSPPSHLPASASRPGFSRPVARFCPPEPEPRQSAGPGAGAASSPEPGGRRRAPRASERAGGRLEPRCCCRASPHPLRPSVPPSLLPSQPPSSQLTASSLRSPPSFFFFLFLPLRSFQT